jgi:hypothetical protein
VVYIRVASVSLRALLGCGTGEITREVVYAGFLPFIGGNQRYAQLQVPSDPPFPLLPPSGAPQARCVESAY